MAHVSGIYKILNITTGKVYIGSAVSLTARKTKHFAELRKGVHHSHKLQRSWDKHGEQSFRFDTLLFCERRDLIFYEQRAIDAYRAASSGYNICATAGNCLGVKRSLDSVERGAAKLRGKTRAPEIGAKISASKMGSKYSAEARLKMSIAGKNRAPATKKAREAMSAAQKGRVNGAEFRKKVSDGRKGIVFSEAHKKAISEAGKGRKQSAETIEKRAQALRGKVRSPELKKKYSAIAFAREAKRREARLKVELQ